MERTRHNTAAVSKLSSVHLYIRRADSVNCLCFTCKCHTAFIYKSTNVSFMCFLMFFCLSAYNYFTVFTLTVLNCLYCFLMFFYLYTVLICSYDVVFYCVFTFICTGPFLQFCLSCCFSIPYWNVFYSVFHCLLLCLFCLSKHFVNLSLKVLHKRLLWLLLVIIIIIMAAQPWL